MTRTKSNKKHNRIYLLTKTKSVPKTALRGMKGRKLAGVHTPYHHHLSYNSKSAIINNGKKGKSGMCVCVCACVCT